MTETKQNPIWYLVGSVLVILALLSGLYLGSASKRSSPTIKNLQTATLYPADFRAIKDFTLQDQHGASFGLNALKGKWSLVFFGFTYCPDVCPNTLQVLKQISDKLSGQTYNIQTIMVSVDPKRDQPERLKEYLAYFDPAFIGLGGDYNALEPFTGSLGVFFSRPDDTTSDDYLVDHSAGIFLVNPKGRPHALFSAPHNPEHISNDLIKILEHY